MVVCNRSCENERRVFYESFKFFTNVSAFSIGIGNYGGLGWSSTEYDRFEITPWRLGAIYRLHKLYQGI